MKIVQYRWNKDIRLTNLSGDSIRDGDRVEYASRNLHAARLPGYLGRSEQDSAFGDGTAQSGDIPVVLFEIVRKAMVTVTVAHKIEEIGIAGVHCCLQ